MISQERLYDAHQCSLHSQEKASITNKTDA